MTKSRQCFQWGLTLFVLLCAVSFNFPLLIVRADDAASAGLNIAPVSLQVDSVSLADSLSQGIRNAVEEIRPSLVTIRTASDRLLGPPLPLLPEFSEDYRPLNSENDLPSFLRSNPDTSTGGTGVIVSEDGLIWTSSDVIKNRESVIVTLQNDTSYAGRVVLNDAASGLAIIKVDAKTLPSVHFERRAKPGIADWAIAVALDDRHEPIISSGFISSFRHGNSESPAGTKMIRFSFPVPGDCGGCAFVNLRGEFLGIQVPSPSGTAGSTAACVALDTEFAIRLQRKVLEDTAATDRELGQSMTDKNKSTDTQGLSHSRKEGKVSGLNMIREMFVVPRSEWTTAAIASSVRNWLTSWQDVSVLQTRPASNASELR